MIHESVQRSFVQQGREDAIPSLDRSSGILPATTITSIIIMLSWKYFRSTVISKLPRLVNGQIKVIISLYLK